MKSLKQLPVLIAKNAEMIAEMRSILPGLKSEMAMMVDAGAMDQMIGSYTVCKREALPMSREMLRLWRIVDLSGTQERELASAERQLLEMEGLVDEVLKLATAVRSRAKGSPLAMTDAELGFAFLTGKVKLPGR